MSSIGDLLGDDQQAELFKSALSLGDVFLLSGIEGIDHSKFFIVTAISGNRLFTLSVYINTNIPIFIMAKQELLDLQVPITKFNNKFLSHDSFVGCHNPFSIRLDKIRAKIKDKTCKVIGSIHQDDLQNIRETIVNSGLLTPKDLNTFFP